jgi:hypothetical protein
MDVESSPRTTVDISQCMDVCQTVETCTHVAFVIPVKACWLKYGTQSEILPRLTADINDITEIVAINPLITTRYY